MSDINDELRGAAEDARREIRGLENIAGNSRGMLHHIHAPGEDGPDDPGASPFWEAQIRDSADALRDAQNVVRDSVGPHGLVPMPTLITTRAVRERYLATLERLARERNEAAYEWTRLRWWQWRKRKRLWNKLFVTGGWRASLPGVPESVVPERVTRCGRVVKRYRVGGC